MGNVLDGASKSLMGERKENAHDNMAKIRILFTQDVALITYSFPHEGYSNNTTEHEATGLELALQMRIANLKIYDYSELIVKQLHMEYIVKNEELIPYHKRGEMLLA